MDLEEWELVPANDGFVDIGQKINLSQYQKEETIQLSSPVKQSGVVRSLRFQASSSWEPVIDGEKETMNLDPRSFETDQEPVPEVFSSKKLEQITECIDMKMDLPRSNSRVTSGCLAQVDGSFIELDESIKTKKDGKDGIESYFETDQDRVPQVSSSKKMEEKVESVDMKMDSASGSLTQIEGSFIKLDETMETKKDGNEQREKIEENGEDWEESGGKSNIWKVGLTGVGAICSFGVAAVATIGVIFLGNNQKNLMNQDNNQKLSFQIFSNNKGMKQVAARGVPVTRAHISYGGYYHQL